MRKRVYLVRATNEETDEVAEISVIRTSEKRAINALRALLSPRDASFHIEVVSITSIENAYKEALHDLICSTVDAGNALSLKKPRQNRITYLNTVREHLDWLRMLAEYAREDK